MKGLNVVLILAVVGCAAYALLPVDVIVKNKPDANRRIKNHQGQLTQVKSIKNYSAIYARALRESLVPVAPKNKMPVASSDQNKFLNMKLLGTVLEAGHTYGLFVGPDGKEKLIKAGQKFNNARIISINESLATLDYNGKSIFLKIIKPPPVVSRKSGEKNSSQSRGSSRRRRPSGKPKPFIRRSLR